MLVAANAITRPRRQIYRHTPLAEGFRLLNITYISFTRECKHKITLLTQKKSEGFSYWHKCEVFQLQCCQNACKSEPS